MTNLLTYFENRTDEMLDLLRQLVEIESPSTSKESIDKLSSFIEDYIKELKLPVERISQTEVGDHLLARWEVGQGKILLLHHMDTVWPVGTIKERPFRVEGELAYGPGAFDMKGGIVITLSVLKAFKELNLKPSKNLTLFFNSDEEIGSHTSKEYIQREAQDLDKCYCMEPGEPPHGALKTARKGVGEFNLTIKGISSHAGQNPWGGVSAIEELAHQIIKLHSLSNRETGTTVNVGVVKGGLARNVVAAEAEAIIDLRATTLEEAEKAMFTIRNLSPVLQGTKLNITGGMNRMPMVRTPQIASMFNEARELASKELNLQLVEAAVGGGSDAQFITEMGKPVLDGLGVVGDGAHAIYEHIVIKSLPQRAALLALLL